MSSWNFEEVKFLFVFFCHQACVYYFLANRSRVKHLSVTAFLFLLPGPLAFATSCFIFTAMSKCCNNWNSFLPGPTNQPTNGCENTTEEIQLFRWFQKDKQMTNFHWIIEWKEMKGNVPKWDGHNHINFWCGKTDLNSVNSGSFLSSSKHPPCFKFDQKIVYFYERYQLFDFFYPSWSYAEPLFSLHKSSRITDESKKRSFRFIKFTTQVGVLW